MSSRSARLSPCTLSRKKEEAEKIDLMLLIQERNGKWVVQRVQCGKVRAKLGLKTKACLQVTLESSSDSREDHVSNEALHVIGLYVLGDKIYLSLLGGWELAKVALSCHMVLDMLCHEMHEAW